MSTNDAAYRLAHRYPGGIAALAARMGANANTLQHKFNPNAGTHRLTLDEAEQATVFSQDPEIAQALAAVCGHVCIPVAVPESLAGKELADKVALVARDF